MTIAINATEERPAALRWDDTHGLYRCPTCDQPPQNLRLGPTDVFLCSDCATYWPTHLATGSYGFWDRDAVDHEHRDRGCLDHPATDTAEAAIATEAPRAAA
ncbi:MULTISPECIES: hypothetical protein [unclassified Pseudonocardia]|uniref:hypothetical protein n=1 Tax=unclassified Pseudonocardia TaxID=2619320 RepID=UPI001CF6D215|nr:MULTISPECIES: hypothetical protein [unclassified Pseudonocardia]